MYSENALEARDEPSKHERKASAKTTATAKTPLRKKQLQKQRQKP
jgi:hypothetical protein